MNRPAEGSDSSWDRLSSLLDEALAIEDAAGRAAWLAAAAGREPELAPELARLLAAAAARGSALDDPAGSARYAGLVEPTPEAHGARVGETIGGWRLREWIGRGGMGEVYLAERSGADFRQRAALKLIAPEIRHPELEARFARERRILSALAHDGIARFLDGGIAADGTPFLALEHVEGKPLLAWSRARRATVGERLRVFLDVCDAVEHAHWNLVVHRDLKPSNILVTDDGRAKLLDFGIAKIVAPESTDHGPAAADPTELRVLTPRYAAPEQLAGGAITPATDVYALGIVLFELLAGRPPATAAAADPYAAARLLAERGAPRLAAAAEIDPSRPEGRRLRRALAADLDRIVAQATAPDPAARYRSAGALADDLRRYLAGRPVEARGGGRLDRAAKFVRRHRLAVGALLAVVLALVAGTVATLQSARRAERAAAAAANEAARASASFQFLLDLFARTDPEQSKGESYTDDDLLRLAGEQLERGFAGRPELAMPLLHHLAVIRMERGQYDEGLALAHRELALRRLHDGPAALSTALARRLVGNLLYLLDRGDEALPYYRASVAALELAGRERSSDYVTAVSGLALVERQMGWLAEAERTSRRALAATEAQFGPESDEFQESCRTLAVLLLQAGRNAEAQPLAERAAALARRLHGIENPVTLLAHANLAIIEGNLGHNARVRAILDEILPIELKVFGPRRPDTLAAFRLRARLEEQEGKFAEALATIEQVLSTVRPDTASTGSTLGWALHHAGYLYLMAGDLATAEARAREAIAVERARTGAAEPAMRTYLAAILLERGAVDEARAEVAGAVATQSARGETKGLFRAETLLVSGRVALATAERARARAELAEALELLATAAPEGNRATARTLEALARALDEPERGRRCAELLGRAAEIAGRLLAPAHPERRRIEAALAACPVPGA